MPLDIQLDRPYSPSYWYPCILLGDKTIAARTSPDSSLAVWSLDDLYTTYRSSYPLIIGVSLDELRQANRNLQARSLIASSCMALLVFSVVITCFWCFVRSRITKLDQPRLGPHSPPISAPHNPAAQRRVHLTIPFDNIAIADYPRRIHFDANHDIVIEVADYATDEEDDDNDDNGFNNANCRAVDFTFGKATSIPSSVDVCSICLCEPVKPVGKMRSFFVLICLIFH